MPNKLTIDKQKQQETFKTAEVKDAAEKNSFVPDQPQQDKTSQKKKSGRWSFLSIPKLAWDKDPKPASKLLMIGAGNLDTEQEKVQDDNRQVKGWMELEGDEFKTESVKRADLKKAELKAIVAEAKSSEAYPGFSEEFRQLIDDLNEVTDPEYKELIREDASEEAEEEDAPKIRYELEKDVAKRVRGYLKDPTLMEKLSETEKNVLSKIAAHYKDMDGSLDIEKAMNKKNAEMMDTSDKENEFHDINMFARTSHRSRLGENREPGTVDRQEIEMEDVSKQALFTHEPNTADIRQGKLGDCYMLASLASICENHPALIKKCIKDEGDHVVVHFFKNDGSPLLVRVKKTIPRFRYKAVSDLTGEVISTKATVKVVSRGALWVQMIEKAYAFARPVLEGWNKNDPRLKKPRHEYVDEGLPHLFLNAITGRQHGIALYPTDTSKLKKRSISDLVEDFHYGEKERYKAELKSKDQKFTAADWNLYKAEKFFGIKITKKKGKAYDAFRTNKIFDAYEKYMKKVIKEEFTAQKISTTGQAEYFINNLDVEKMPKINIPGLDDNIMRRHFLDYFKEYLAGSRKLFQSVNRTGEYTEEEKKLFENLKSLSDRKADMVTPTPEFELRLKKGKNADGDDSVSGVYMRHGYTLIRVEQKDGRRFVVLRNTYGRGVRKYDEEKKRSVFYDKDGKAGTDGIFRMEWRDYLYTFNALYYEVGGRNRKQ